jgi:hypothetical protein
MIGGLKILPVEDMHNAVPSSQSKEPSSAVRDQEVNSNVGVKILEGCEVVKSTLHNKPPVEQYAQDALGRASNTPGSSRKLEQPMD